MAENNTNGAVGGVKNIYQFLTLDISEILRGIDSEQETNVFHYRFPGCADTLIFHLQINGLYERQLEVMYFDATNDDQIESTIHLAYKYSNMVNGKLVWFWVCPESNVTCRKLLLCPDSKCFKHKDCFSNKIYYPCQYLTPDQRKPYRIQLVQSKLSELKEAHKTDIYSGQYTRGAIKIAKMENYLLNHAASEYLSCFQPTLRA